MSRIHGIEEIVLADVHPERMKAIKAMTWALGQNPLQISSHLFPESKEDSRAGRVRERMLGRLEDALVRKQGTMVIMPSILAVNHGMFRDVDQLCAKTWQNIRLILATCRSSRSVRHALRADPSLVEFVDTYHHVHMTMAEDSRPKELANLEKALASLPPLTQAIRRAA